MALVKNLWKMITICINIKLIIPLALAKLILLLYKKLSKPNKMLNRPSNKLYK